MKRLQTLLGIGPKASWAVVIALTGWVAVIIASGAGWNPWPAHWDFTNTGAFGDSFGPVSALMASVAAVSAILAFRAQAAEISRLQRRQSVEDSERRSAEQKARNRERERDRDNRQTLFEGTFFNLLEMFTKIVSQVDIRTGQGVSKTAQDAFQSMLYFYGNSLNATHGNRQAAWNGTIDRYRNDLNHYFRFMYHLVNFVDNSDATDKYFYTRLIRSMLSESEIILLGLNCDLGEGREKFLPLVEKYALLHNMSETGRKEWFNTTSINDAAFMSKP